MNLLRPLLLLALVSGPLSAQAGVWVVDGQGSGDFTTISAAIAAAAPGDTILVHTGSYESFTLGKGLTITAGEGKDVSVSGFTVGGIPAAQTAVVRGLATPSPILLDGNAGTVWLEEVSAAVFSSAPALTVQSCAAVVIVRADFAGGPGYSFFLLVDPGPALSATDSVIHMHGSLLRGGMGSHGSSGFSGHDGGDGAPGAILDGTFLFMADSKIVGGPGGFGDSYNPICADPGDGGPGIAFAGGDSQVHTLDAESLGGPGGVDTTPFGECFGATGHQGPATFGAAGTVSSFSGEALALVTPRTVQPGGDVKLALSGGPPGALVFLALGEEPFDLFVPSLAGTILVAPPYLVLPLGVLDGGGTLGAQFLLHGLPPGIQVKHTFGQAGYITSAGGVILGAPSVVTLLDAAF